LFFVKFVTALTTIVTALFAVSVNPTSLIEMVNSVKAACILCIGSA